MVCARSWRKIDTTRVISRNSGIQSATIGLRFGGAAYYNSPLLMAGPSLPGDTHE
jgi:hypothetical protein